MANNYLQFSEAIYELKAEEKDWLEKRLNQMESEEEAPFDYTFTNNSVNFFAEEYGDTYALALLVQEFLAKFRPNKSFSINYAETCSKMRVEEFSGGAVFVTAHGIEYCNPRQWLETKISEFFAKTTKISA
jgi:hypothetical protein